MSNIVDRAEAYAILHHGEQTYGDEFPYKMHLQAVVSVLRRFNCTNDEAQCVGWLHDVLEDTPTATYEDLDMFFGRFIADTVAALTEPKGDREWKHSQAYPRINQSELAIIVKLADRIANVEAGGKKTGMYRKEHAEFKAALTNGKERAPMFYMWEYLDSLLIKVSTEKETV